MSRKQTEFPPAIRIRDDAFQNDPSGGDPHGREGSLHIQDFLVRLLNRWHWVALGAVLGLALGFYQVWRAIPQYQARATVVVRDYNISVMGQLDAAEFDLRNSQAIETVRAGLMTFELCEAVASDPTVRDLKGIVPPSPKAIPFLGSKEKDEAAANDAPPAPRLAGMIQSWLSVSVRPETRLIDIAIRHPKPQVAQTLANRIVEHYMKRRTDSRSGTQQDTLEFLLAESKRVKKELQDAQSVLASYSAPLEAEKELAAAETDVQALSLRYRHKHPKMIEAQARLKQAQDRLRDFLGKAVRNPFDGDYWASHRDRMGDLTSPEIIDQIRDLLISRRSVLESEIQSQDKLYGSLLGQMETREVNSKQTDAEVTPQEAARLPGSPVYPQKASMILKASALGLFAGLALAIFFQYLDNKFHTVTDVEGQLDLPVLSAIVSLDEKVIAKEEAKKQKDGGGLLPGRELWDEHIVFRVDGANTHYAEMFRVLRTAVSLLGPADQRKITMVTSALPSEGKTLVAANLAIALAQQGLRTLLVDFDLRKPSVHKMFGKPKDGQPGIVDLLAGKASLEQIVQFDTGQQNLTLILSGPKAPNPGELLAPGRLDKLLTVLRNHFDHIVIDTAPILAVPDSRILAPFANNLLLAVRAEATPRVAAQRAIEILESFGVTPDGVVFNGYLERRTLMGKNYSYGYYRYGKYGYGKYGTYSGYGTYGTYGSVYGETEDEEEEQNVRA